MNNRSMIAMRDKDNTGATVYSICTDECGNFQCRDLLVIHFTKMHEHQVCSDSYTMHLSIMLWDRDCSPDLWGATTNRI